MDLTLVWVLGFFPVWVLGIVDYHGSRLVALEPLAWPSAAQVVRATERAIAAAGAPERVLTDRGGVFRSRVFERMLSSRGITHTLTRPCHPWTNGRIERIFRTFKETVGTHYWLVLTASCTESIVTFLAPCSRTNLWHYGRTVSSVPTR